MYFNTEDIFIYCIFHSMFGVSHASLFFFLYLSWQAGILKEKEGNLQEKSVKIEKTPPCSQEGTCVKRKCSEIILMFLCVCVCVCVICSVESDSLQPRGLQPTRLLCPLNSPDNTGVGCHSLLQGIIPTQGLNLGLLHFRQILYQLSHEGSPVNIPVNTVNQFECLGSS